MQKFTMSLTDAEVAMLVGVLRLTHGEGLSGLHEELIDYLIAKDPLLLEAAIKMGKNLAFESGTFNEEEELSVAMKG